MSFLRFEISIHGVTAPSGPGPPDYRRFIFTLRNDTFGRTPLDVWSARRWDFYLQHPTITRDRPPCRRRDSNPQSQQTIGRRPTS